MKLGLILFASAMAFAGEARAGPQLVGSLITAESPRHAHRSVSFRLVEDPEFDPGPVHHYGIVGSTQIAPNATVGVGVLKSRPKKPSGDWKFDNGAPHPRKVAVDFVLRF